MEAALRLAALPITLSTAPKVIRSALREGGAAPPAAAAAAAVPSQLYTPDQAPCPQLDEVVREMLSIALIYQERAGAEGKEAA